MNSCLSLVRLIRCVGKAYFTTRYRVVFHFQNWCIIGAWGSKTGEIRPIYRTAVQYSELEKPLWYITKRGGHVNYGLPDWWR